MHRQPSMGWGMTLTSTAQQTTEQVRARYAAAAMAVSAGHQAGCDPSTSSDQGGCCARTESVSCCSPASCAPETVEVGQSFGAGLYTEAERAELPAEALAASLGCGNPLAVAELRHGETVLD